MNKTTNSNDLQEILSHAIKQMKQELGDKFDPEHINLAELERRTGISRARLKITDLFTPPVRFEETAIPE